MAKTPNQGFTLLGSEEMLEPRHYNQLAEFLDSVQSEIGGWGDYQDDRDENNPITVSANTPTDILNNAGGANQLQELPNAEDYPNGLVSDGRIQGNPGDFLLITVEFTVERQAGNGEYTVASWFEIGLPGDVELYRRTDRVPGQGVPRRKTFTVGAYTLDTWQANGAVFRVETSANTNIYDVRFVVARVYRGIGTYPAV